MFVTDNKKLLLYCVLLLFSTNHAYSQSVEKQNVLAVLTLNIARFTSWPEHTSSTHKPTLNLCIFGDNIVQQSFKNIDNKIINNKAIHIIHLSRLRNLKQCQLLYLSGLDRNRLIPLLIELKNQAILTIGESREFLQSGGMVALEDLNGKIQLTINLPSTKKATLVISSRLLKLANIFDSSPQQSH